MKKGTNYEISHLENRVIVTRKFLENASRLNSPEEKLCRRFKQMGFSIEIRERTKHDKKSSPLRSLKVKEEKKPLIPYEKMARYISLLTDSDKMMDEFDSIRRAALTQKHPRLYVNDWFNQTFPNYGKIPELTEDNRIVHKLIQKAPIEPLSIAG